VNATSEEIADAVKLSKFTKDDPELAEDFRVLSDVPAPEVGSLMRRLSERRFIDNPALLKSVVSRAVGAKGKKPKPGDVIAALSVVADPKLGEGLARIARENPKLAASLAKQPISKTGELGDVDEMARHVPAKGFKEFTEELTKTVKSRGKLREGLAALRTKHLPKS